MKMEKRVYITRNTTALHFRAFLLLYLYISDVAPFSLALVFSDTRYTLLYDLYTVDGFEFEFVVERGVECAYTVLVFGGMGDRVIL